MKIAYFINHYPKVSHSFIRREIQALERQGFSIDRIALRGWDDSLPGADDVAERALTRYLLRKGIWPLLLPTLAAGLRSPLRFLSALRLALKAARGSQRSILYHLIYLAEACRLLEWLRRGGVQHVHAHFGTNSTEVVMLARSLGGPPYSFTAHGPDEFLAPMCLEEKIHRAEFVIAVSQFGRSQLYLNSRHEDWPRIEVVHCGLEPGLLASPAAAANAGSRLVCVGRLCEAKGQLLLIEAAAALMHKGLPFELLLAGDGPIRAELERLLDQYRLRERVRISGWIGGEQVRLEIESARALVLPSFAEGLPVVIMEAMALRRPVLSTYIAGIPELVVPGETGWLFPAGSLTALTQAMEECLAAPPSELQRMGEAARARVIVRHSIDTEAAKLATLIRASAADGGGELLSP